MSKVLIEESTLTALGDALRSKEFIPATRKGTIMVDYLTLTLNTVSDTDPYWNGEYEQSSTIDISFSEATSLKFEMEAYAAGNKSTFGPIGRVYFDYDYLFPITKTKDGDEYYSNTVFSSNTSGTVSITRESSHSLGVIIRIYPLDAEGNVIPGLVPKEIDITNTVPPATMIESIYNYEGVKLPEEAYVISGSCSWRWSSPEGNWYFDALGDKLTSKDITNLSYIFNNNNKLVRVPCTLNIKNCYSFGSAFSGCHALEECPKIRGSITWSTGTDMGTMLSNCRRIRNFEDLFEPDMLDGFNTVKVTGAYSCAKALVFNECHSLRTVPTWFYKFKLNEDSTSYPTIYSGYNIYYGAFQYCYSLDEVLNMPVWKCNAAQTSNMFSSTISYCGRLKNFTFETQADGTPYTTEWKSQTIDLSTYVGYTNSTSNITSSNAGITSDKHVRDLEKYNVLKNDPDWFTSDMAFSRYNHDSAVATINSLPDTSAYLASAGGTNTIKFKGNQGAITDGGAINTLTAEEIAVATAKGWTVTLS